METDDILAYLDAQLAPEARPALPPARLQFIQKIAVTRGLGEALYLGWDAKVSLLIDEATKIGSASGADLTRDPAFLKAVAQRDRYARYAPSGKGGSTIKSVRVTRR